MFEGRAKLADAVSQHMCPPLPLIGAGEPVSAAAKALRECDAVMVVEDGKPVGVLTRQDLLGFLSDGTPRCRPVAPPTDAHPGKCGEPSEGPAER